MADATELTIELNAALVAEIKRLRELVAEKNNALRVLAHGESMEASPGNVRVALPSVYRFFAKAALEKE